MTSYPALPRTQWIWGPNGKRVEVWIFPPETGDQTTEIPCTKGVTDDDDFPAVDPSFIEFTAVSTAQVKIFPKLDEFALNVLLAQSSETPSGDK